MAKATKRLQKARHEKRFRPGPKALQEIRNYRKSCSQLVQKIPYKYLIKEIAPDLKGVCDDDSKAVKTLHEASQAYLAGLFGDNPVNACRAKRESTSFLLSMAFIGLKKVITVLGNDKELAKKIQSQEDFDFSQTIGHIHAHGHEHHHHDHHHHHDRGHDEDETLPLSENVDGPQQDGNDQSILDLMGDSIDDLISIPHQQIHQGFHHAHGDNIWTLRPHGHNENEEIPFSGTVDEHEEPEREQSVANTYGSTLNEVAEQEEEGQNNNDMTIPFE